MLFPSVSDAYARAVGGFLRARGLPPGAQPLVAARTRVEGAFFGDALTRAGHELGDPALGAAFGLRVGGAAFGLLGVAAASAGTLREAIHHLQRFEALTSTLGRLQMREEARTVTLCWQPDAPVAPSVVEAILAGWVSFGRYLLDEPVPVLGVCFTHKACAPAWHHEDLLACPVRFGAESNAVVIPRELLALKPRCADARLNAALSAWLDGCTVAVQASAHRPVTQRVAALLSLEDLYAIDQESAAARLRFSARTLQRRLAGEGTRFRHLLDAARAQRGIVGVLRGDLPLLELGAHVGFEEQSSLCRAFRRWTGYAPLALRQRLASLAGELRP